jgi:hypothetical protein
MKSQHDPHDLPSDNLQRPAACPLGNFVPSADESTMGNFIRVSENPATVSFL